MKFILLLLTLYYVIITNLLLFVTKKHLRTDYLFLSVIFFLYFLATILAIFGILNSFNIFVVDNNTTNYLSELDFLVEVPETESVINEKVLNDNNENIFCKFINLFNNTKYYDPFIAVELKNTYYINNIKSMNYNNNIEWLDIYRKYTYISCNNNEMLFFIDCFTDILNDLESIQSDLSKRK